jgi:hypothetical protein
MKLLSQLEGLVIQNKQLAQYVKKRPESKVYQCTKLQYPVKKIAAPSNKTQVDHLKRAETSIPYI